MCLMPRPAVFNQDADLQSQLLEAYNNGLITNSEYQMLAQGSLFSDEEDQGELMEITSMAR